MAAFTTTSLNWQPPAPCCRPRAAAPASCCTSWLRSDAKASRCTPYLATLVPLSAAEWQRVPAPCAGLGAALPDVLARSDAEPALLVQHLPEASKQRLRMAALCLGRAQRRHGASLPAPLVRALLAECLL